MVAFARQEMIDMLDGVKEFGTIIKDNIIDHRRWSVDHRIIFERDGKFYSTVYSVGATESQDESPWEFDGDMIDCIEVRKTTKTIEVWEPLT